MSLQPPISAIQIPMKTLEQCAAERSQDRIDDSWHYATPVGSPITNTTAVPLQAAQAANVRNAIKSIQIYNTSTTVNSVVTIQDGSTVLWTGYAPYQSASLQMKPVEITFGTALIGSSATALNFVAATTGANIFVSAQGFHC